MTEAAKAAVDTTNLLTVLALVAAVWAVIPASSRLNFRLRLSLLDGVIVGGVTLIVHYLVFEDVLRALGWYYTLGPWRWNLDKNSLAYLLVLGLAGYIWARSGTTKLRRRNIRTFERLFNTLLMTKQYGELAPLLEQHILTVFKIADHRTIRGRLARVIRPPAIFPIALPFAAGAKKLPWPTKVAYKFRSFVADRLEINGKPEAAAKEIVRKLLTSHPLITYLAVSYPYLCLEILNDPVGLREDFSDIFIQALMEDETSIFYSELKNNHNLNRHHRLALPEENRLINFFLKDVRVAAKFGVYRSVGEVACRLIEFDDKLAAVHNGPLGYYDEVGRYKCPIYCSIHFFEIMVHEGLHQGMQDHLWLYYFSHFTDKILARLRPIKADDHLHEFPSPFHYLLYKIVSITMDWIDEAQYLDDRTAVQLDGCSLSDDNGYIPFSAASAMGQIINSIISSDKLGDRFKTYMLEVVLRRLQRIQSIKDMKNISRVLEKFIIYRDEIWTTEITYREELKKLYRNIDHVIRAGTQDFARELDTSLA